MPPVGNDVVDLTAPGNSGKWRDGRFCSRVFTAEERAFIHGAPRPDAMLWALWAAKEAAYKALCRKEPRVCSIPHQYRVEIDRDGAPSHLPVHREPSALTGRVVTPRGTLALRIMRTPEWVHALAAETREALDRLYRSVASPEKDADPSVFVRAGLVREIARLLDCEVADLSVAGDRTCPSAPGVLFRGYPLTNEISLSHDGRFTAFAFDPLALVFPLSPG